MLFPIFLAILIIFILYVALVPDPPAILGRYSQPGKWYHLKYWTMYALLMLRRLQNARQQEVSGKDAGWGKRSRNTPEDMDKAQVLPKEHPKAVDAVYFNGASSNGTYFVAATARRHENLVQTILYIRLPGVGLLEMPSLPDTSLYTTKELSFSAAGLEIAPVNAMKTWTIKYDGKMRLRKTPDGEGEEVHVRFEVDWNAITQFFDFDTDMNPAVIADAMATEPWSREFFKQLEVAHQTHYEQFGEITGTIKISGHGDHEITVRGVRDHSYGNIRDWSDLHRYAIQYLHLEDGTSIAIGKICMPRTLSRLPIGYVISPSGAMSVMTSTDLELHKLGEDGQPPKECEFSFHAGGERFHVKCYVLDAPIFYMGLNWEARIHERMCVFDVNGIKGWGISEWDYRNETGKPDHFKESNGPKKF